MMIGPSCFTFTSYFEALGFGIQFLPHGLYFDRNPVVVRLRTADYQGLNGPLRITSLSIVGRS